jgi:PhnB protein
MISSYLFFNGNCGDAMRFYERALGGRLEIMTYEQAPPGEAPPNVDPGRIMHAYLKFDQGGLMASDDMPGAEYKGMHGFYLSLDYPTAADAKRVFDALAEGGTITMPMEKTFWSESFGMLRDRFGTPWMVSVNM